MSSNPATAAPPSDLANTSFRRTAGLVIGLLLALVAGLTAAGAVRGPHLVRAEVNTASAVEHPGQRLTLRLDQAVTVPTPNDVTVDPTTPVELTNLPTSAVLKFTTALHYATTYRVSLAVQSADTGRRSTITSSFTTPEPTLYTLQRASADPTQAGADPGAVAGPPDRIVRSVVGSAGSTVVRTQPHIQEFAIAEPQMAVVTADADGIGSIQVGPTDSPDKTRTVTEGERISDLKSSGPNGIFGYIAVNETAATGPTALNTVQLRLFAPGADARPVDVTGLDGKPVQVADWSFVPGTTLVVVQATNSAMYLVDPSRDGHVTPLGGHLTLHGLGRGTTLLVEDEDTKLTTIDLVTGATTRLPPFNVHGGGLPHVQPLPDGTSYAGLLLTLTGHDQLRYSVVVLHGRKARTLHRAPADTTADAICLSSNGEYLLLQTRPADASQADDTGAANTVIDIATGQTLLEAAGSDASWCH